MSITELRPVESDEYVRDAVAALEEALADAKAGKLAWVIVYGNVRGADHLKAYKGSCQDRLSIAGMLAMALHDLCLEKGSQP